MVVVLEKTFNLAKVSKQASAATLRPKSPKQKNYFWGGPDQCDMVWNERGGFAKNN